MVACLGQYQELNGKFGVHHATGAVLDIKHVTLDRMRRADLLAHAHNFRGEAMRIAWRLNHGLTDGVKAPAQASITQHEPRAGHGLVFPRPGRIAAALLLVVGIGGKRGDQ